MARYKGPRVRISRRFGIPIFGPSKYLERRNYPPAFTAPNPAASSPITALGLVEKQKLRYYYGLMERQFRGVYRKGAQAPRGHGRTDVADFGDAPRQRGAITSVLGTTRAAARQMVAHGHIQVNGRKVSIPSYALEGERRHYREEQHACRARWRRRRWNCPPAAPCRTGCR